MELALENEYRKVAMELASKALEALTVERDELRYGLEQMTRQFEGANVAFNRAMQLKAEAESALVQAEQARDEARQQCDQALAALRDAESRLAAADPDAPSTCESCGTPILSDGDARTTEDDVLLCKDCYEECPL